MEGKQYVVHHLMILRHLLSKFCIPGELNTAVPTGGTQSDILEPTAGAPDASANVAPKSANTEALL